jgi:hypothetical protein
MEPMGEGGRAGSPAASDHQAGVVDQAGRDTQLQQR